MGLVTSTPIFDDDDDVTAEADALLKPYSCYKLLDFPRLLLLQTSQASSHHHSSSSRAPILTASSCDEDEEVDSIPDTLPPRKEQLQPPPTEPAAMAVANETLSSSRKRRTPRVFDLYETDSTLIVPMDDDEDEDDDIASAQSSSRRTLPFRRCTRHNCSCCSTTRPAMSINEQQQQQQQHHHEDDQHLLGLSILPVLSTTISDVSEFSVSSSRHQRNRLRSDSSLHKSTNSAGSTTTATNKPPRLPTSPKLWRPPHPKVPQDTRGNGGVGTRNGTMTSTNTRSRARSEDFVDNGNLFPSAEPSSEKPDCSTSQDLADANSAPLSSQKAALTEGKMRSRSEDFVDLPGKPIGRRTRANSTPHSPTLLAESSTISSTETIPKPTIKATLPTSPTSVLHHHHFPTVPSIKKNPISQPSSLVSHGETLQSQGYYVEARAEYRRLLDTIHPITNHIKADLYHRIAWTHYQESSYSAALCVVKHALEIVQLAHGCLTLEDLIQCVSANPSTITTTCQIADLIVTQAKIHASLHDRSQSKRLAKTALKILIEKQNHTDSASQIIFAKGLLVLGKSYVTSADGYNHKAMQHYHQALQILSYFQQHLAVAETIHLMGEASPLSLASPSYSQALMIQYRQHQDLQQTQDDIATTLARLGWNALVCGQLESALEFTRQALERTSNPRNLASIQYQLGLIFSRQGKSSEALRKWKKALKMQRSIFAGANHIDVARTCEVIAVEYQRLEKYDRASSFLDGASEIYSEPENIARIQSRLAHHFVVYEKDDSRAKRAWNKASQLYKHQQIPLDEVGNLAKRTVSALKKKQQQQQQQQPKVL